VARLRVRDPFPEKLACQQEYCGICGATILNANWLITAGHCCYRRSSELSKERDTLREVNRMNFQVGGHFDSSCSTTDMHKRCKHYDGVHADKIGVIVNATRIIPYPSYRNHSHFNQAKLRYDYCLVEVTAIAFDSINRDGILRADAVTLPKSHVPFSIGVANEQNVTGNCQIAGWGTTGDHNYAKQSSELMSTQVRVMSDKFCQRSKHPTYKRIRPEYEFCAGETNRDSCEGDSGGPLYCASNLTDGNNVDVLYGIVSRGPRNGCGRAGQPGIYAKVSTIVPWIRTYTTGMLN